MARVLRDTPDLSVSPDPRLGLVTDFARALERAQGVHDVVDAGAAALQTAVAADSVAIGRFDGAQGTVEILCSVGDPGPSGHPTPAGGPYRAIDHPLVHAVVAAESWMHSTGQSGRDDPDERFLRKARRGAHLAAPITVGGLVWGGVYATRAERQPAFRSDDLQLTTVMTTLIAAGLAQVERVETLALLATTDPMTGLANRRAIDDAMEAALDRYRGTGEPVTVMLCDVDGLKRVNDSYGHAAGDLLLTRVSSLLSVGCARLPGSIAGRVGGDEFALLAPGIGVDELAAVTADICIAARTLPFGGGVSCGIATSLNLPTGPTTSLAKALYRAADSAQYRAKRSGGGQIAVASVPGSAFDTSTVDSEHRAILPSRRATDVPGQLRDCIAAAVAALNDADHGGVADRLALLAEVVARHCAANGWSVFSTDVVPGVLVARAAGTFRSNPWATLAVGGKLELAKYALSAAAVRGGAYSVSIDDGADLSAERAALISSDSVGLLAAGGTDGGGGGWLVTILVDDVSELPGGSDLAGMASVLRSLVALALAPVSPLTGRP
jgi:diguanylate cyclase (GGDEF)-like protein